MDILNLAVTFSGILRTWKDSFEIAFQYHFTDTLSFFLKVNQYINS